MLTEPIAVTLQVISYLHTWASRLGVSDLLERALEQGGQPSTGAQT